MMKAYEKLKKDSDKQADRLQLLRQQLNNADALIDAGQWETVTISSAKSPTAFVKVGHGVEMEVLDAAEFRRELRDLIARHCNHGVPVALVEEILAEKTAVVED